MTDLVAYAKKHAACPRCGNDSMPEQTAGIISGKNLNRCFCPCGWHGTVHERVPVKEEPDARR